MSGVLLEWSARLRTAGTSGAPCLPAQGSSDAEKSAYIRAFADERGHRRAVDSAFLSCLLGSGRPGEGAGTRGAADVELWMLCARPDGAMIPAWLRPRGPLTPGHESTAIEIWTETELCCLHALWRLARQRGDGALRRRCLEGAAWHVRELQPDNVTGHPWGVHVFVALLDATGDADARVHAEFMVHAAIIDGGRPDRLSACVLLDGAQELELAAG